MTLADLGPNPYTSSGLDDEFERGRARYVDVAAVLSGRNAAPAPTVGTRTDGLHVFYPRRVNGIVGDPESGKTWLLQAVEAEALLVGRRVLHLDLDHNGPEAIVGNLRQLGVPVEFLIDPDRFRLLEPEDGTEYLAAVADATEWRPEVIGIDSLGELIPMLGGSSRVDDEFTAINRQAVTPFTAHGAVIYIDHLAKSEASREYGGTGTMAKKRAANGSLLRVTATRAFVPGEGGKAKVTVIKDRHGAVRRSSVAGAREQHAADFELVQLPDDGGLDWKLWAPGPAPVVRTDLDELRTLDPAPTSARDVIRRMHWGQARSTAAWNQFKEQHS